MHRLVQNWLGGPKLQKGQYLGGDFVFYFVRGENHNFLKHRGAKTAIKPKFI